MCVDQNECVSCGACIDTCIHDARRFADDCNEFFTDLKNGKTFSVLVAPSFHLSYPDEYKNILGYLKSLGVKDIYPVSLGADITVWGYINYINQNNTTGNIAQPCPSIVRYIEMHKPELLPKLIPIQSPLMCTAIYLRQYENVKEDFIFLSPCISKKIEIESDRGLGLIKHNVTFKNIMQYIKMQGINLADYAPVDTELEYGIGSLLSKSGGISTNIEHYLGSGASIFQIEGELKSYGYLDNLATSLSKQSTLTPNLIDIVNCKMCCNYGSGTEFRHNCDYSIEYRSIALHKEKYESDTHPDRLTHLNKKFKHLNIKDFMCKYDYTSAAQVKTITDAEIDLVLKEKLMKLTDNDQHIDCAACGYRTCRQMAEAIAHDINHHNNCLYYVKNNLTKSIEENTVLESGLRAIINSMPLIANIKDKDFNIIECNYETLRLFGFRNKQEYIDRYEEIFPPFQPDGQDSFKKIKRMHYEALQKGYANYEWVTRTLSGELIPLDITLIRLNWHDEDHVLTFAKDRREHYQILEYTELSQKRLQAMLDASPMLCAVFDENFNITNVNDEAITILKLKDKQEYIDRFFDLSPEYQPDGQLSRTKAFEAVKYALETGKNFIAEWHHLATDGEITPVAVHLERIDIGGKNAVVSYCNDLRRQNDMLAKLEDAIEKEQTANSAKTRFLSSMSHEIRTPLNSILGITELELQKDVHPKETEDSFARIHNSSRMLLALINDILDLTKVEAGKIEIIPDKYETSSMIVDTIQLNVMYIGNKRITFKVTVDENLPTFLIGDELRIKQVLNNLISNAFKYTAKGEVCLLIAVEKEPVSDKIILLIEVNDSGQGMTKEQVNTLFNEEFTRFNLSSNRDIEGSGLGLVITNRLVKMMGGSIKVQSEPKKGSSFSIRLPQQKVDDQVLGKQAAEKLQKLEDAQKFLKKVSKLDREPMPYGRVLVVDDVESNLYVASESLIPYKISIDTVDSGLDAILKIKSGEVYDIIFMDHMMPDIDGIEATRAIREMGYNHPIIALTANALNDSAKMFMENGFDDFISKPIDLHELDKHLLRFIYSKQSAETIEEARMTKIQSDDGNVIVKPQSSDMLAAFFLSDAKKAIEVMDTTINNDHITDADFKAYTVQAHAIKSALFNINKRDASAQAFELEQLGRNQDFKSLKKATQQFLLNLKSIVNELETHRDNNASVEDEDIDFLRQSLLTIWEACEQYDVDKAREMLHLLNKKSYTKHTREILSTIAGNILSGDFEEAGKLAKQTAGRG